DNVLGEKIRIARFKAKSRERKARGFRSKLTKLKIVKIG
ncbi:50S ribosomal protein L21, partial [Candidatus Roizmanbacteria bacterium CG_4_8_14_3_um_filter_34_9]